MVPLPVLSSNNPFHVSSNIEPNLRPEMLASAFNNQPTNQVFQTAPNRLANAVSNLNAEPQQQLIGALLQLTNSGMLDPNPLLLQNILAPVMMTAINPIVTTPHSSTITQPMSLKNEFAETFVKTEDPSVLTTITGAFSSLSNVLESQISPTCSSLLQLVVRLALKACLPHSSQLNIQGQLQISDESNVNSERSTQDTIVLKFTDSLGNPQPDVQPENKSSSIDQLSIDQSFSSSVEQNHHSELPNGSTRRKPLNPVKYNPCDFPQVAVLNSVTSSASPNAVSINPSSRSPHSAPTSPSIDSEILDLSMSSSLISSAPITPMKDLNVLSDALQSSIYDVQLFDVYQKHLQAQLQSAWTRASMGFGGYHVMEVDQTPEYLSSIFISPSKLTRRQRTASRSLGSLGGRMRSIRRPNPNRHFSCNQCQQEFPSLHTLEEHTFSQHGTYRCHVCKAEFTQRSNLQRHALKHVGFKPFECRVCFKAYYRKDHLMRHMEMGHPGYTPRENITVHLTSSESLDYLTRSYPVTSTNELSHGEPIETKEPNTSSPDGYQLHQSIPTVIADDNLPASGAASSDGHDSNCCLSNVSMAEAVKPSTESDDEMSSPTEAFTGEGKLEIIV